MVCEQTLGLLNATDLRDLPEADADLLENLDYKGLVESHAHHEAVVCARHFAQVRNKLLQEHPWVFARKTVMPAQLAHCSLPGWRYAYALPADCLKVLALVEMAGGAFHHNNHSRYLGGYHQATGAVVLEHYEQVGRSIGCNYKNINMRYTAEIKDTALWDPSFIDTFCATLASVIAHAVCGSPSLAITAARAMVDAAQASILQAHRTGAVSGCHELPRQEALWMVYSGVPTGFDDLSRQGYMRG
jgi:hypothetical protein